MQLRASLQTERLRYDPYGPGCASTTTFNPGLPVVIAFVYPAAEKLRGPPDGISVPDGHATVTALSSTAEAGRYCGAQRTRQKKYGCLPVLTAGHIEILIRRLVCWTDIFHSQEGEKMSGIRALYKHLAATDGSIVPPVHRRHQRLRPCAGPSKGVL